VLAMVCPNLATCENVSSCVNIRDILRPATYISISANVSKPPTLALDFSAPNRSAGPVWRTPRPDVVESKP
jgi:hypothetical protein